MNVRIISNVVDIFNQKVFPAEVQVAEGIIDAIRPISGKMQAVQEHFLLPGFVDAHVHIESSMLIPSQFARLAVVHGTVATVSDPHEIANVCGVQGVDYMLEDSKKVPFKFFFGAPSCVPATQFETSGATLDAKAVAKLLSRREIKYLSEMMNFPGVLHEDPEVMAKILAARRANKPVDGHAPGLRGDLARRYIAAGMTTDHECVSSEEALDKLAYGMKIIVREGSAAKNFEALVDLLKTHEDQMMFCSDDKHPDSLVSGHINRLCARAVAKGINLYSVLKAACLNPVLHYGLDVGLLRVGDPADFVLVKDLQYFEVLETYVAGELVAKEGRTLIQTSDTFSSTPINHFSCSIKKVHEFGYPSDGSYSSAKQILIEALDGQLITGKIIRELPLENGMLHSNPDEDLLKMVVVNRYHDAPVAKVFVKNFGLKAGAIASSVAHDSHNIVAVGVTDEDICRAVNLIIQHRGGVSCTCGEDQTILALPVAGLMTHQDGYAVARQYTEIDQKAKRLGSSLSSPFMTLSFMSLLVIPHLKLSDLGLFDVDQFELIKR